MRTTATTKASIDVLKKCEKHWLVLSIALLLGLTSCVNGVRTTLGITNLSGKTATVRSADSGEPVDVKPNSLAIIPHTTGSLDVLLPDGKAWHYSEISVFDYKKFASPHPHKFKVSELRLNLVLMSNGVIQIVQETNKMRVVIKEIIPENRPEPK